MQKVDLSKYHSGYKQKKWKISVWHFINALFFNSFNPLIGLKVFLLKMFGAKIGKGLYIKPYVNIKFPWLLTIGDYCWIGENVWIDNLTDVTIGNNCCISQGAMLLCGNHNYKKQTFDLILGKIVIEDGAWIGAKSVVCPGVTVKSHAILTVGSVASNDLEAYRIYKGNPAVVVRKREIGVELI